MNTRRLTVIAVVILVEAAVIAGSVALGVYIGTQRAKTDQTLARQQDRAQEDQTPGPSQDRSTHGPSAGRQEPQPTKPGGVGGEKGVAPQPNKAARTDPAQSGPTAEAPPGPGQSGGPEIAGGWESLPTHYKIAASALLLIAIALAVYILFIKPWLNARPLREALKIIDRNELPDLPEAEGLLGQALVGGLRAKKIAEARFALAYVRARMGRLSEASAVLTDLIGSGNREREPIYLYLWVESRLKEYQKVERIYEEHSALLGDLLDTKLIAGIAYLRRARTHWSRREVDGALHYFDELRKLGVLSEEIPAHIADHEVVVGIMSLFDKNPDEARRHFSAAVEAAAKQDKSTVNGKLGLLLCDWNTSDNPDIDDALAELVSTLESGHAQERELAVTECTFCGKEFDVGRRDEGKIVTCTGCRRRFTVETITDRSSSSNEEDQEPARRDLLLGEEDVLLRNVSLWHAVSLIFTWQRLPGHSGLPESEQKQLVSRLQEVKAIDQEMCDPYLLEGLICYYFAQADEQRQAAVASLDKATGSGVNVPEVLNLLDRERRLARLQLDSTNRFFSLVKDYLGNPTVSEELREQLKARLEQFSRFKQMGDIDMVKGEADTAPSIIEIQTRGALLRKRVNTIVKPQLAKAEPQERKSIESLMQKLDRTTGILSKRLEHLERTEHGLMEATGEFLFKEEETAE